MRVLVTGADGFVGRNLRVRLAEAKRFEVLAHRRADGDAALAGLAARADAVVHLAGVNRPPSEDEFERGNVGSVRALCEALAAAGRRDVPVVLSSSTQAGRDTPYGRSKLAGERTLREAAAAGTVVPYVHRLPNVFGKWSRPNYNSAVATFCHNLARGLPIEVHDRSAALTLVYVDDVVDAFVDVLDGRGAPDAEGLCHVPVQYRCTVGQLADTIEGFARDRRALRIGRVGTGLERALYATFVSFLPGDAFAYPVPRHADPRGVFVEMLKTPDAGQFSFFTAHPGITRGGHYHHSKTEKFLVIQGRARFRFRHLLTDERRELTVDGAEPQVVDTVPGWTHDITNVGDREMIVMLWANEVFDPQRPDTVAAEV